MQDAEASGGNGRRRRPNLAQEISQELRQDILVGKLPVGARLPSEREIANRFGASQPTVREAIRVLDASGLLEVRQGSGTYVSDNEGYSTALALQNLLQFSRIGILEVLDAREVLGLESAKRAATRATPADLAAMEQSLDRLGQIHDAGSVNDVLDRIIAFQEAISVAAHTPLLSGLESILIKLLLLLQLGPIGSRGLSNWQARSLGFQDDRKAILEAIANKEPDAAFAAMAHYLSHQRQTFQDDPDLRKMSITDPQATKTLSDIVLGMRDFGQASKRRSDQ